MSRKDSKELEESQKAAQEHSSEHRKLGLRVGGSSHAWNAGCIESIDFLAWMRW